MEIVKVCKKHGELTIDQLYIVKRKRSINPMKVCKQCDRLSQLNYKSRNKGKYRLVHNLYNKKYREKNKEKIAARRKQLKKPPSPELFLKKQRAVYNKTIGLLNNTFLCGSHGMLTEKDIYTYPNGKRRCRPCQSEASKKHKIDNRERRNQRQKELRKINKEHLAEGTKRRYYENREKILGNQRSWAAKNRDKLRAKRQRKVDFLEDSYVKNRICARTTLSTLDIPVEMIEFKRAHLLLKRKLKEIRENGNTKH